MRGRTNVMQRKDPTINGLIRNFTVATGNTITKGDFVSYKLYDEKITVKSGRVFYLGQKIYDELHYRNIVKQRIGNQYYLVLVDTSESYEEVSALTFDNDFYYEVSNGYIYVLERYNRFLKVYGIVNDEFVFIDEVSLPYSDYATLGGINIINSQGTVGIFVLNQTSTQTYYPINFDGTTIVIGQAISVPTNINFSSNYMTAYYGDNKLVIFGKVRAGTSSSTYYPRLVLCEYNNGAISVLGTTDITSYFSSIFDILDLQTRNGLVILTGSTTTSSTLTSGASYLFYVGSDNNFVFIITKSLVLSDDSANFITDEIVNVSGYIYTWNNNSKILKLWSGIDPNHSVGKGAIFIKPGSQFVGVYTDSDVSPIQYKFSVFVYDVEEEEITIGKLTDSVESYSGGFTVGFAKTGGNAGDIIQVYVPQISS